MKKAQLGFGLIEPALILLVLVLVTSAGLYVYTHSGSKTTSKISLKSGADIEIISGAGGMPPDTTPGTPLVGEEFTVVFAEPFTSLENWQTSKDIKKITTDSGKANVDLPAGKYGVYYIYKGQKTLYSDLTLKNPRNDIQRDKQGPWYIKINNLERTKLKFSINSAPS
jgi:hypothetical protein